MEICFSFGCSWTLTYVSAFPVVYQYTGGWSSSTKPLWPEPERSRKVKLSSPTLVERGVELCLQYSCEFRLMVAGETAVMLVFLEDDVKVAASQEVTEVAVSARTQTFLPKHLGAVKS